MSSKLSRRSSLAGLFAAATVTSIAPVRDAHAFTTRQKVLINNGAGAPLLNLDFTNRNFPSQIIFSRSSSAWYYDNTGVLRQAGNNIPRFDYDPVAHTLNGLLVEEQATNLALYSAGIGSTGWSNSGNTATANYATAPDGTNTASLISVSGPQYSGTYQTITVTANTTYTASVWLKSVSGDTTNVGIGWYATGEGQHSLATTITGTWTRYTGTFTTGASTTSISLQIYDSNATPAATSFLAWGAQLEQKSFATSYIPTTSVTVTRAADVAYAKLAGVLNNSNSFSVTAEFINGNTTPSGYATVLQIDSGSGSGIEILTTPTNNPPVRIYVAASGGSANTNYPYSTIGKIKVGFSVLGSKIFAVFNGGSLSGYQISSLPPNEQYLRIGGGPGLVYMNCWIRKIKLFDYLSPSALGAATK